MTWIAFSHVVLTVFVLYSSPRVSGTRIDELTNHSWDGVSMYIVVDRQTVQTALEEFYHAGINKNNIYCNHRPRLYLPTKPAFPDILTSFEHVIYFSFGESRLLDFPGDTDSLLYDNNPVVTVVIPLLAATPGGLPQYSLAVGQLYDRNIGKIVKPNVILPYIPIDEVFLNETSLFLRNGTDEMRLAFQRNNHPCKPLTNAVRHEAEEFIDVDLQFGLAEPNFGVCAGHYYDNHFCSTVRNTSCAISRAVPNICQLPWKTAEQHACTATVEVITITSAFRKFLHLSDNPLRLVGMESRNIIATIGLQYPCI